MKVFDLKDLNLIKQVEKSCSNGYMGYVYILELDDMVKIGCTTQPYQRVLLLKKQAEQYGNITLGRIALSKEHTNYRENETIMHKHFKEFRKNGTELFNVSLQNAMEEFSKSIQLLDESEIMGKKDCAFSDFLHKFVTGQIPIESSPIPTIRTFNIADYIEEKPKRSTSKNNRKGDTKLMDENQKDFLRSQLEDYIQRNGVDTHKAKFQCAICGDKDGANFIPNTNRTVWKCFSAKHSGYPKNSGDIFEYVQQLNNVDFKGACAILKDIYTNGCEVTPKVNRASKEEKKPQKDHIGLYNRALQNQFNAVDYLKSRGLTHADEIAKEFQIGYVPEYAYEFKDNKPSKTTPAVIIPLSDHSYSWRSTTENIKKKSGTIYPLNLKCLQNNAIKWVFLVEGEYDTFSILDITKDIPNCEFSAICLSSAVNLEKFIDVYISKNIQADTGLIIALDNDKNPNDSIKQATQKGLSMAKKYKIPCVVADVKKLYLNQKDSNEALKFNREEFKKALINEVERAKTLDISQYMADCDELINELQTTQNGDIITYEFNYIGEIDRAFDLSYNVLRYCHQSKTWYRYNGIKLEIDTKERFINELHQQIDIQLKKEISHFKTLNNEELLKNARKEHKTAISKIGLLNAIDGMKRRDPIAIELLELDKSNFLNCQNVTLDLEHLTVHQHKIEDLCTKLAPSLFGIELNPKYVAHWNKFISDIMCNDKNMVEFLQRVCGYCLYPTNREECFFIFFGATTRNGKSTLLESIKNVLGDYAKAVSSATLSERPTGKEANPEIISLIGSKLITCGELNSETLLNDTLLKSWIGNDTISARNLFDNNVLNFHLDGKLYANCNELPPMKNDDLLNSNRIIVIPFDRHFQEHEQNKNLKRLFAIPEYKAVILAWLIEGYKSYLRLGIKAHMPEKVKQAIENYQSEANSINVFLNDEDIFERIDIKNYADAIKITDKNLYSTYVEWCKENNCKPLSSANFKKQLRKNKAYSGNNYKQQNGERFKDFLISYKLKPSIIVTDTRKNDNPDRLIAISQRELDKLKNK